ncbi:MAG TPA: O-antigen ligase family protein [Kofleriaceae bacterium]
MRGAQIAIVLAIAGALAPIVASRRVLGRFSPLVVLAALAAALTALQLVPLPHAALDALNPTSTALRDDGAALTGISPGHTITLDVPGTLGALIFFIALLGLAIVALRVATSQAGRYRLVALVALLCVACALVGGIHKLFDLVDVYGLYGDTGGQQLLTPLINGNQSACLMAVGTTLSIGLVVHPHQKSWLRATWLVCALVCALACLMTLSRGGALALGVGGFVTIAVLVAQRFVANDTPRRRRASFLSSSLPIGIVSVCAVIVVLYASAGGVKDQFTHTSFDELHAPRSKFAAWRSALELINESPWVGVGRGAFEPVFQRVHPASGYATYTHLENEYLQAVVDWGVPGALLLSFVTIWLVVLALRRWRDGPLAAGALGALAAVLLQSNVDFGIEFFGLAAPMTVVAATLVYVPLRETTPRNLVATRVVRIAHVAGLIVAAALLGTNITTPISEDHRLLETRTIVSAEELQGTLARHPFDYYGYARLAESMMRANQPGAVRLLNHALVLHPTDAGLHLAAARMLLAAKHADQAAIEYAATLPAARDQRRIVAEIAQRLSPEIAATAIPVDIEMLDAYLKLLIDLKRDDIAIAWLERVVLLKPQALHACERLFTLATEHADLAAIDAVKQRCPEYQPSQEDRLALAKLLHAKQADAAIVPLLSDVESWQGRSDEKIDAWLLLCEAQIALARFGDAKHCLRQLDGTGIVPQEFAAQLAEALERADEGERAGGHK